MSIQFAILSHSAAALAFLVVAVLLVAGRGGRETSRWLIAACLLTALWAASVAAAPMVSGLGLTVGALELLRAGAWIAFLLSLLVPLWRRAGHGMPARLPLAALVAFVGLAIAADLALVALVGRDADTLRFEIAVFSRLALSVCGLLLIENLYRNTEPEHRWNVKFLCLAVGALFAYDFALCSDALLFQRANPDLLAARGLTSAAVVPLIALSGWRKAVGSVGMFVSHRVAFHSATLVASGLYLLTMAAVGYYLRVVGGSLGPAVLAVFVFAAFLILAVVLFSGRFRAWLRVVVSKHFFSYRYDYREEWLRLIATLSDQSSGSALPLRVIKALANIVESPEGALWLREQRDHFRLMESWNCSPPPESVRADPGFVSFLDEANWVLDLDEHARAPGNYPDFVLPEALRRTERAWLVVPLLHHQRLVGFVTLGQPRVPRDLDWEDFDLLRTAARQAASHLAEHELAHLLAETRQFDAFNRRFAFVMHDIKNLVSQLSLMVANAEKHGHNPDFQADMLQTVGESVDKMKRLLVRLHEGGKEAAATQAVELVPFLRRTVENSMCDGAVLTFDCQVDGIAVVAEEERLAAVIAHLIDNAIEASDERGHVRLRLSAGGAEAVIEVEDEGRGMDAAFVRDQLFRPFRSTRPGGYGIGAYESREFVREIGGKLDVVSVPGVGTKVTISLPILQLAERALGDQRNLALQ